MFNAISLSSTQLTVKWNQHNSENQFQIKLNPIKIKISKNHGDISHAASNVVNVNKTATGNSF